LNDATISLHSTSWSEVEGNTAMSVSAESQPRGSHWWNVPNQITTVRLILAIAVFACIALEHFAAALVIFLIAASTDWLDGYWARRFKQVTKLGRILDPFVDKFIICGVFVFLAAVHGSGVLPWMAVLVVARELLVTALRGEVEGAGGDFSANRSGKLKMLFQCAAAAASMVSLSVGSTHYFVAIARDVCIWVAILLTIYSGGIYVLAAIRILRSKKSSSAD
jgi:CDP-diacylglycerol--glycerol-3-phosphate 3-phosphatidyltransferase